MDQTTTPQPSGNTPPQPVTPFPASSDMPPSPPPAATDPVASQAQAAIDQATTTPPAEVPPQLPNIPTEANDTLASPPTTPTTTPPTNETPPPPPAASNQPPQNPANPGKSKLPFILIGLLVIAVLGGGALLLFLNSQTKQEPEAMMQTEETEQLQNPFDQFEETTSSGQTENPFATESGYTNPFDQMEETPPASASQAYRNPFQ